MRKAQRYVIWLGYWALLCLSTHLPPHAAIQLPTTWLDGLLHLLTFVLLALLTFWALGSRGTLRTITLLSMLLAYAALDELTQAWVDRTPDFQDWLADAAGLCIGTISAVLCRCGQPGTPATGQSSGVLM